MLTIEIDFEVYKYLTNLRSSEEVTYNDILRDLIELSPVENQREDEIISGNAPFISQGVKFPHGDKLRANHKGIIYHAVIDDGSIIYDNKRYSSPSLAAIAITGYNVNGWRFWEYYNSEKNAWIKIDNLRKN